MQRCPQLGKSHKPCTESARGNCLQHVSAWQLCKPHLQQSDLMQPQQTLDLAKQFSDTMPFLLPFPTHWLAQQHVLLTNLMSPSHGRLARLAGFISLFAVFFSNAAASVHSMYSAVDLISCLILFTIPFHWLCQQRCTVAMSFPPSPSRLAASACTSAWFHP